MLTELDLGKRNSMSKVRRGGKVFGRCMENCLQCTGDMPTARDFLPLYGPSCRTVGGLCAYAAVEMRVPYVVCGGTNRGQLGWNGSGSVFQI